MTARVIAVLVALLVAGCAAAGVGIVHSRSSSAPEPAQAFTHVHTLTHVTGIAAQDLAGFDTACRCTPNLTTRYIRWGEPASSVNLVTDLQHGAVPLAELEPYGVTLASIAAGDQDVYLTEFAKQVAALRTLVLMSFAPEANNDSYPWGFKETSSAAYVAAWRRVTNVFRKAGASSVRWVWVMNATSPTTAPLPPLWPGGLYVDYVGLDGYATHSYTTFTSLFGPTITQARQLSHAPILITETSADPDAGQARWLSETIAGVAADHLLGFVWFDINQVDGSDPDAPKGNRRNWSIDKDLSVLAAFRAVVNKYG